jgi:large subunit ribosomal protein L9
MQVILREHVEHLGRRGEVVKVAPGYARNYLIPKKLAYLVTDGVQRQIDSESKGKASRENRERQEADTLANRLRELTVIRLQRRVGESGVLFGSVTSSDIAEELARQGFAIDKRQIRLDEPIKRVGTHRVPLHVHRDVDVELAIEVEPLEEGSAS